MHEVGAVVLELPVLIFLPALLLLGQAVYLVAHQQAVDIGAVSLWHHRLGGVEQDHTAAGAKGMAWAVAEAFFYGSAFIVGQGNNN